MSLTSDSGSNPADARLGRTAGDYRLLRILGSGGMGVVYEAEHVTMGQRAAVKVVRLEHDVPDFKRAQLLEEARLAAKAEHPGIVQVYQVGDFDEEHLFFLMEKVAGGSLQQWLRSKSASGPNLPQCTALLAQVASAMAGAHANGVVHCDIKPENILLSTDPEFPGGLRAKVADFGIARRLQGAERLRTSGTAAYMSPEQCIGTLPLDGQSDVYSLGCVLYESVSGRKVFPDRDRAELIVAHVKTDPEPLRRVCPQAPRELDRLVMAMLQKRPSARPSMKEVASALHAINQAIDALRLRHHHRLRSLWLLGVCLLVVPGAWLVWHIRSRPADMAFVPGATFQLGSTKEEREAFLREQISKHMPEVGSYLKENYLNREGPPHWVQVSGFWLDRKEVSCGEYVSWLNRARRDGVVSVRPYQDRQGATADLVYFQQTPIVNLSATHRTPCIARGAGAAFVVRSGRSEYPVTTVTWEGATLYCQAQQKRLPTEAEWELAAKGTEARRFPWGNEWPTCDRALLARGDDWNQCSRGDLLPRGSMTGDQTPLGIMDLGGSVMEWVADEFAESYGAAGRGLVAVGVSPLIDPTYTGNEPGGIEARRSVRGGCWSCDLSAARTTARWAKKPTYTDGYIGFRCARSQP